tara:strand:+ start:1116 stop:1337 length:222 start_codon:yes stop_codon:yes gene_type:complete
MKDYSQLTLEKRYGIYSLHKIGQTQLKIAKVVGFHKSRCDITIIKATPNESKKDYINNKGAKVINDKIRKIIL